MADAAPASPSAAAAEAPAAPAAPLEALQPIGPSSAEVYAIVPQLRAALQEAGLPADSKLWGAELLNADDKAGATVLGKCVRRRGPARQSPRSSGPGGRPAGTRRAARGRALTRPLGAPGSCARAT
jgi:hypothetical protein